VSTGPLVHVAISALQWPDALVAARRAWNTPDGVRLLEGCPAAAPAAAYGWLRELLEEFTPRADLLALDAADLIALYGVLPLRAARRLRAMGAGAVLVRMSAEISLLVCADPAGAVRADGPADLVIGLPVAPSGPDLLARLAVRGRPAQIAEWMCLVEDLLGT
jgi:hypothetical protein